ncbi:hypothetical protein V8D89_003870 [Ganoderma adspersum]
MAGPVVLVHAQFPTVRPGYPGHSDLSTWVWVPCLKFPVDRVNELQFSSKPFKWIRYCIGAVTGTQGHLSHNADSLDVVDYDQPLSSESASMALYYHVSDTEKSLMFPTDPHLADRPKTNSVHSHASTTTSSIACEEFHQALRERDTHCVAAGWGEMCCDAVHLVPHCKDDDYIRTLTARRCRGRKEDIVRAIDDVRNGLLLTAGFHKFIRQTVAFIPLPNFAMDSNDVVPGADPSEKMCIIHIFQPLAPLDFAAGTRLRLAESGADSDAANQRYPPPALFDAVYGATVLHEFGVPDVRARVAAMWDELYYPRGGTSGARAARDVVRARVSGSQLERGGPDYLDFAMLVPYMAMSPAELVRYLDDVDAEAEEDAHRRMAERVKRWREDVASSAA